MYLTKLVWIDAVTIALMFVSLYTCAANKRRHRKHDKSTSVRDKDHNIDSNITGLSSLTYKTVDSKWIQNGYKMWTIDTYPNPQIQPRKCGRPRQPSFLCDPDGILSPLEADKLDRVLNETCAETKCACQSCDSPWFQHDADQCHGYKVAVAIVYQLAPPVINGPLNISKEGLRWADGLRKTKWQYGLCGDDIVILLVVNVSKVYVTVGRKAQELVTSDCIAKAHTDTALLLQEGRYADVVVHIVQLYKTVLISGKTDVCTSHSDIYLNPGAIAVIALFSAFTVIAIISAICCVCGACKRNIGDAKRTKRSSGEELKRISGISGIPHGHESGYGAHPQDYVDQCDRRSDSPGDICNTYSESYPMTRSSRHHVQDDYNSQIADIHHGRHISHGNTQIPNHKIDGASPRQQYEYTEVNS